LRIVLEFHHVEMAVVGAHEMRLRSTAHPSHVLDSFYRHGGILAFSSQRSAKCIYRKEREGRKGTRYIACRILCAHCALCGSRLNADG
jgi:hypothetical protein